MTIFLMVCLITLLGMALWLVYLMGYEKEKGGWVAVPFILALLIVALIGVFMYTEGFGNPSTDPQSNSLKTGAVYEVLGAVPVDNEYVVVIRRSDGWTRVYQLKKVPPKIFIKTDNQENPFVPYPNGK